jgi:hypothetical protein
MLLVALLLHSWRTTDNRLVSLRATTSPGRPPKSLR